MSAPLASSSVSTFPAPSPPIPGPCETRPGPGTGGKTGFGLPAAPTLPVSLLPAWKAALDPFTPGTAAQDEDEFKTPSSWLTCFDFTASEKRLSVNRNTGRRLASPPASITFYPDPSADGACPRLAAPLGPGSLPSAPRTPLRGRAGSIPKHKLFCSTPSSALSPASMSEVFLALGEPRSAEG